MIQNVVIATHHADAAGDLITINSIAEDQKDVIITKDFQYHIVLGYARNIRTDGERILGDLEVLEKHKGIKGWPALGFGTTSYLNNEQGGRTFQKIIINQVSICSSPNVDEKVPAIEL